MALYNIHITITKIAYTLRCHIFHGMVVQPFKGIYFEENRVSLSMSDNVKEHVRKHVGLMFISVFSGVKILKTNSSLLSHSGP